MNHHPPFSLLPPVKNNNGGVLLSFSNENHQVTNGKSSNHEGSNRVESNDSKKAQSCAKHPSGRKKMQRSRGMNQNSRAVRSLFVHCIHIEGIFAMLNLDWIVPWRWIPMDDRLRAFLPIGKEKQRSSWIEPITLRTSTAEWI